MHFGATLRLLRLESGLGLRDLARRLGVSSAYLSRVENGLDPAPTAARLTHLARELGVPAPLLVELARRASPFLVDYMDQVPEAGAFFLELAHRRLDAHQLAELRAFVDARFPAATAGRVAAAPSGLAQLLAPDRVVLGLSCGGMADVLEVLAGRLTAAVGGSSDALLAALRAREELGSSAIGGGMAVPCASVTNAPEVAALATLASPLSYATPDHEPLRLVVILLGPPHGSQRMLRLAEVARLATRGLADTLGEVETPAQAITKLARLEALR